MNFKLSIMSLCRQLLLWFRESIHRKFAIAVLPIIVSTIILILGIDELIHFRHDSMRVVERQDQMAVGYRQLLSTSLSANDLAAVRDIVTTIARDKDVAGVAVVDGAGAIIASSGKRGLEPSSIYQHRKEFSYRQGSGRANIGYLEFTITNINIRAKMIERVQIKSLAILSLTIFLFILIRLTNAAIITTPINRMIDSIEANIRAGTLRPVNFNGVDQISRFGRAYNAQTEQIRRHQSELNDSNSRLEKMVETRTAQLSDALLRAERATQNVTRIANQDDVTGLLNRRGFMARLREAIAGEKPGRWKVALFLLDLDRFKNVNDTLGHAAGDDLLRIVGERLKNISREESVIGRVGGDEFAIYIGGSMSEAEIATLAERTLAAFKDPIRVAGRPVHAGISIGISAFPDDSRDADQLMTHADIALYKAKDSGRGRFVVFNTDMALAVVERDRIEIDLRRGIREKNGVAVYFQPKIDLKCGAVIGFEALVRWRRGNDEIIGPDQFLPIASERGVLFDISEQIAENIRDVIQHFSAKTILPFSVAINIHADQLTSRDHIENILETIGKSGLGMDQFTLEITEGCILGRGKEQALEHLIEMRRNGLKLSLDDFGTGYASLTHLKQLPMDELKIDKSFVQNLGKDSGDEAIIRSAVELAHAFDMNVVAEGVETHAQLEAVLNLGCDQVQGYLLGRPEDSFRAIERFFETYNSGASALTAA